MKVKELINLIATTQTDASLSDRNDLSLLQATLEPLSEWTVKRFCEEIAPRPPAKPAKHRPRATPSSPAKQNGAHIEQFLSEYRAVVSRIADDSISFEQLRRLAARLQGRDFSAKEALALARECGVSGAKSKKQAAERLGQNLISLKATLTKTPM